MGNFQSLIPRDIMDSVIELVLAEIHAGRKAVDNRIANSRLIEEAFRKENVVESDKMEEQIARNVQLEESADLSLTAMLDTERRREMFKTVAHLFDDQRSLDKGAYWEKVEIGGKDHILIQLAAKYYGPKREILLRQGELKCNECRDDSIFWKVMREIGFEVQEVLEKRKKGDKGREWWNAGKEIVDVTELIKMWGNPDKTLFCVHPFHQPIGWQAAEGLDKLNKAKREGIIRLVFAEWAKKNPLRTKGYLRTDDDRTLLDISTSVWWVAGVTLKQNE